MIVRVASELDAPADAVWRAMLSLDTFRYITRGLLGTTPAGLVSERFRAGDVLRMRLWFFHVIPGWTHELRIVEVSPERREIRTEERGGMIAVWKHRLRAEALTDDRCRYSDEIELGAGWLTLPVWLYAQLFYRYRHWRWRRLARTLK